MKSVLIFALTAACISNAEAAKKEILNKSEKVRVYRVVESALNSTNFDDCTRKKSTDGRDIEVRNYDNSGDSDPDTISYYNPEQWAKRSSPSRPPVYGTVSFSKLISMDGKDHLAWDRRSDRIFVDGNKVIISSFDPSYEEIGLPVYTRETYTLDNANKKLIGLREIQCSQKVDQSVHCEISLACTNTPSSY